MAQKLNKNIFDGTTSVVTIHKDGDISIVMTTKHVVSIMPPSIGYHVCIGSVVDSDHYDLDSAIKQYNILVEATTG